MPLQNSWFSARNFFQVTLPPPVILRRFLHFWKICGPLISLMTAPVSHHKLPGLFLISVTQSWAPHNSWTSRLSFHIETPTTHSYFTDMGVSYSVGYGHQLKTTVSCLSRLVNMNIWTLLCHKCCFPYKCKCLWVSVHVQWCTATYSKKQSLQMIWSQSHMTTTI